MPLRLVLIDGHPDGLELLSRTLYQKFPHAFISHLRDSALAVITVAAHEIDAVVLHRSVQEEAVELVRALRSVNPDVPIVVISGIDRSEAVFRVGADGFFDLSHERLLGNFVENVIAHKAGKPSVTPSEHGVMSADLR